MTDVQTSTAMERARAFAGVSGEIVRYDPNLLDAETPQDFIPEGVADFGDVEGYAPDLAIKVPLKEMEGHQVLVVGVSFVPTPANFLQEKRARGLDPELETAVVVYRVAGDDRFYVSIAGNSRVMRQARTIAQMLERVEGVRGRIISYQSTGGTGYCFGPSEAD